MYGIPPPFLLGLAYIWRTNKGAKIMAAIVEGAIIRCPTTQGSRILLPCESVFKSDTKGLKRFRIFGVSSEMLPQPHRFGRDMSHSPSPPEARLCILKQATRRQRAKQDHAQPCRCAEDASTALRTCILANGLDERGCIHHARLHMLISQRAPRLSRPTVCATHTQYVHMFYARYQA